MNRITLATRGLFFHWRTHLGAVLAAALGSAVLVGALLVGDSVRYTLRTMATERLGKVEFALVGGDRFFKADLAERIRTVHHSAEGVLTVPGVCINDSSSLQANQTQVIGIADSFWKIGEHGFAGNLKSGEVVINEKLATVLDAKVGDSIRIRIYKPGLLPRDAPLGSEKDQSVLLREKVVAILPNRGLGRFDLSANQIAPLNAFVPIADLQDRIDQKGRANLLLVCGTEGGLRVTESLRQNWTPDDAQLTTRLDEKNHFFEVSTPRVFLDESFTSEFTKTNAAGGVLAYFVNFIHGGNSATPYSMVAAGVPPLVDEGLKDDEIILNSWTAEDLGVIAGEKVELEYYVMGLMRKLETRKAEFKVKRIVPIEGLYADKKLMPEFPGIADVDSTHDWDSGIPIDMKKIRDKDEDYWKKYRGTPKAFITLKHGVELWKNRFGELTALRFADETAKGKVTEAALKLMPPLLPVRAHAHAAAANALDFGMLFLGFSFFLIVAALLLMALIFRFSAEERSAETGLLLAVGFKPRDVRRIFWAEGALLAAIGSLLGIPAGIFYAQFLLEALGSRWQAAVGTSALEYHAEPQSIAVGCLSAIVVAALAIFLAVRKQASRPARELLNARGASEPAQARPSSAWRFIAAISFVAAIAIVFTAGKSGGTSAAGAFFGAGALMLTAAICSIRILLSNRLAGETPALRVGALGIRGATRRPGRSLATAALLASGSFLIAAVGANQLDANQNAEAKASGTGGFALYARSTIPIFEDLNSEKGRDALGLPNDGFSDVSIYSFRVKAGDEASCLNLNRAQRPRIVGVPDAFVQRGGFTFADSLSGDKANPWTALKRQSPGEPIPAICDFQSLMWAMGLQVGAEFSITDESGRAQKIKFVGAVANSILQGSILIAEDEFLKLYPSESGYAQFLIDSPPGKSGELAKMLGKSLADEGFEAQPAAARLAEFNAVQNTYLLTFQALGGLGLLLGSLGLGVVVLRNVLERRAELAVLRAIGFSRASVGWLVFSEHLWLLFLGMLAGIASSLLAVIPTVRASSVPFPWLSLSVTLLAVALCGVFSAVVATWWTMRGTLVSALRNE